MKKYLVVNYNVTDEKVNKVKIFDKIEDAEDYCNKEVHDLYNSYIKDGYPKDMWEIDDDYLYEYTFRHYDDRYVPKWHIETIEI